MARRRLRLPKAAVLTSAAAAPGALAVALPRSRRRDVAICALQMWAYLAAYEMPHDDPEALAARVRVRYPVVLDQMLGLGRIPSVRLQHAFSRQGRISRVERVLILSHWIWFFVPHASVAYVMLRRPAQFRRAAVRMYAVFDIGAVFYWLIPTAPPWWASNLGELAGGDDMRLRRLMIEFGPEFWGDSWTELYSLLGGNPLAAMPSLHFATSVMAARLLTEVGPVAGAVGWVYAGTLGLALVYLGEHYAVDLIAGAALTETVRRNADRFAPAARAVAAGLERLQLRAAAG